MLPVFGRREALHGNDLAFYREGMRGVLDRLGADRRPQQEDNRPSNQQRRRRERAARRPRRRKSLVAEHGAYSSGVDSPTARTRWNLRQVVLSYSVTPQ